ncbi:MAG TPA: Arc family DNA-binding protein [Candidatus Dormibacteraeota bacterium]|nr:Arc family DNA-binding protein [Candidatus Dormibacteraeota bacterium]
MPTLYVENVPKDTYEALRKRAKENRRSLAAEVIALLEANIPTEKELRRRREVVRKLMQLRASVPVVPGRFPTAEEMIREDRER